MTENSRKRQFAVISNPVLEDKEEQNKKDNRKYNKNQQQSYQTNPLREQFMRFVNEEAGKRFTVEDLLKW